MNSEVEKLKDELEALRQLHEGDLYTIARLGRCCQVAADTMQVINEWLGSASTREAAYDSMWRLDRTLRQAGFPPKREPLEWRGLVLAALEKEGFGADDDNSVRVWAGPRWARPEGKPLWEILLLLRRSLEDLIANARLLKQCPVPDGCDICKAEGAMRNLDEGRANALPVSTR